MWIVGNLMGKMFHYNILYEDIILEVESKAKERESVLCMGRQDNAVDDTLLDIYSVV